MRIFILALTLALLSSTALAQGTDPTGAGTDPAAPPSDLAAAKALADQQKAFYDAVTAAANARKASIEANQAADKAKLGSVEGQTDIKGTIEAKSGTAKAEALLLVTRSTGLAAIQIAADVKPALSKVPTLPILLLTDTAQLGAADAVQFDIQISAIGVALQFAQQQYELARANDFTSPRGAAGEGNDRGLPALALAGTVIDNLAKLGSYFQSDYSFSEVTVESTPNLVATAFVDAARRAEIANRLIIPANLVASDSDALLAPLRPLELAYLTVAGQQAQAKLRAAALQKIDDPRALAAAGRFAAADASAGKALSSFDTLMTSLSAPAADGKDPLAIRIVRQKKVQQALARETLILLLSSKEAGAYYTKRSLWTFFGGPPLYTMGGVSVAYSLYQAGDGTVLQAGAVGKHGGYRSVGSVEKLFK